MSYEETLLRIALDNPRVVVMTAENRAAVRGLFRDQNETLRRVLEAIDARPGADDALMAILFAEVDASAERIELEYPEFPASECPEGSPTPPELPDDFAKATTEQANKESST